MSDLPPSVKKAQELQKQKDKTENRVTKIVVPEGKSYVGETAHQAYISRSSSRGQSTFSGTEGASVTNPNNQTKEVMLTDNIKQVVSAEQKVAQEEQAKAKEAYYKQETPEQKAVTLLYAQQNIPGSPKFEALRAQAISAELKKSKPGEYTSYLAGGKIKLKSTISQAKQENKQEQINEAVELQPNKSKYEGKATVSEEKLNTIQKLERNLFLSQSVKTGFTPIVAGSVAFGYYFLKGTKTGAIEFLKFAAEGANPVTGVIAGGKIAYSMLKTIKTGAPEIGEAIRTNPAKLAEIGGEFYGFGLIPGFAIKKFGTPKVSQYVTVEIQPERISKTEMNKLGKLSTPKNKFTSSELAQMEQYTKIDENTYLIKTTTLKGKNLEFIKGLQEKGTVESSFLEKPQVDGIVAGTKFKTWRMIEAEKGPTKLGLESQKINAEANKKLSESFIKGYAENVKKSRALDIQRATVEENVAVSTKTEAEIRAKMAETGKTAKEIYAEMKAKEKYIPSSPKNVKGVETREVREFDEMTQKQKEAGPFGKLYAKQPKQVLILEEQYAPPKEPMTQIKLMDIKSLAYSKPFINMAAFNLIPKNQNIAISKGSTASQPSISIQQNTTSNIGTQIKSEIKVDTRQIVSPQSAFKTTTETKSIQDTKTSLISQVKTQQATRLQTEVKTQQVTQVKTKLAEITKQKSIQKEKSVTVPNFRFFNTTIPKIKSKNKRQKFTVSIRRKGKFKPLALSFETPEQAFTAGKIRAEETLAASFKVESEGKPVLPKFTPMQFYKSKRESGVIIQQRGFRLGRRSEVQEIQRAKRIRNIFGG